MRDAPFARLAAILCTAVFATAATANITEGPFEEDEPDAESEELEPARAGGYIAVGGAVALENFKANYATSGSVTFRVGVRGHPYVAVELLGEVLPKIDGRGSNRGNDVSGFAITVNGKLLLPLGRFEPYLMTGIGVLDIDQDRRGDKEDFAFRGAAGFDVYLSRFWAVYSEVAYVLPAGEVDDFDYATAGLGLLFRF